MLKLFVAPFLVLFFAFSAQAQTCAQLFEAANSHPTLQRLREAIVAEKLPEYKTHKLIIVDNRTTFKMGYLSSKFPETLRALGQAVSEGKIDHIDVGDLVGGKMFKWLQRTIHQIPSGHRMIITGIIHMNLVMLYSEDGLVERNWSYDDQKDFNTALNRLGVRDAGIKLFGSPRPEDWHCIKFRYDSSKANGFTWKRYEPPDLL